MITKNPQLKEIFPKPPMPALRQPPNLCKIICKGKLYDTDRKNHDQGWKKCHLSEKMGHHVVFVYTRIIIHLKLR